MGSALFSRVGTGQLPRAELVITGEGIALSALTGGGLKLRSHHFRLSFVHWCFPTVQGQSNARSWLSLCWHLAHAVPVPLALVPGAAGLGHLPGPAHQVLAQTLSHLGWDKDLNPGLEPVI